PLERHLAALEPARRVATRTSLVPLVPATARLAQARSRTAAQPLALAMRPVRPPQFAQLRHLRLASTELFHPDQVPDVEEHAADRRIVLVDDRLLVSPEAQGPERRPMLGRPTDAAADLRDLQPHGLG